MLRFSAWFFVILVICPVAVLAQNAIILPSQESTLTLSGKVTDAKTGEPLPAFNVYFGHFGPAIQRVSMNHDQGYWESKRNADSNGSYHFSGSNTQASVFAVKMTAEGYETAVSRYISPDEGTLTLDFALEKLPPEKSARVHGIVLLPDGKPAADVNVVMATFYNPQCLILNGRQIEEREIHTGDRRIGTKQTGNENPYITSTDNEGRFQFGYIDFEEEHSVRGNTLFPEQKKVDFVLYFLHDSGFGRLPQPDWEKDKTIILQPWGRIEGIARIGSQLNKNQVVWCQASFIPPNQMNPFRSVGFPLTPDHNRLRYDDITTDESGKFSIERVAPGSFVKVSRMIERSNYHPMEVFQMKPGETVKMTLGGTGRPMIGHLVLSEGFETAPDWNSAYVNCRQPDEISDYPREEIKELEEKMIPKDLLYNYRPVEKADLLEAWGETGEGKKFKAAWNELTKDVRAVLVRNANKRATNRSCSVAPDGTFRFDDMPEGDWILTVHLGEIGFLEHAFTIAAIPGGQSDEPLDLGTLEVERVVTEVKDAGLKQTIKAGEPAPDFEITRIEPISADGNFEDKGAKLRLSDYTGKYVVLDFWATWCGPCLAKIPELKTLYETIKDDDRFVVIGISLDDANSEEQIGKLIAQRGMTWLNGWAGDFGSETARNYGIQTIPALLLIGPDGKVLLSNPIFAELTKKIDDLR